MPSADIGSRELGYVRLGSGPPLLLIQGMGGHHANWGEAFLGPLAERFDVIAYDHRGIGPSTDVPGEFTVAQLADDARRLLDALDCLSAHVMGISMGGMVAQELALSAADRVRSLVLGCTRAGAVGEPRPPGPARMLAGMSARNSEVALRASFAVNLSAAFTSDERHFAPFKAATLSVRVPVHVVRRQSRAAAGHEATSRLPGLTVPTLVLHGTADQMVFCAEGERLAELIPGARLQTLDGAGHMFWWERPSESAEAVSRFLPG